MGDFDFRALGCKDAHVALMYDRGNYTDRFFHVIFGVSNNVRIGIRTEKGALAPYNIDGTYMDCYNWKQFRICEYMLTKCFGRHFECLYLGQTFYVSPLPSPPPLLPRFRRLWMVCYYLHILHALVDSDYSVSYLFPQRGTMAPSRCLLRMGIRLVLSTLESCSMWITSCCPPTVPCKSVGKYLQVWIFNIQSIIIHINCKKFHFKQINPKVISMKIHKNFIS